MQLTAFPFSRNKINTSDIFNDGLLKNLNINISFFHNYHGDSPLVSIIILFQCGVVTYLCNSVVTFPLGQKKMSSVMAQLFFTTVMDSIIQLGDVECLVTSLCN